MTIYVSEPYKKDSTRYRKPERIAASYQPGGAQFRDLPNLVSQHPACIYFSDDAAADGLLQIDTEDYVLYVNFGGGFTYAHQSSGTVLLRTEHVSLETLTWLAEQHHAGVKDPRR